MTTPNDTQNIAASKSFEEGQKAIFDFSMPKPKPSRSRVERSAPVRNPAFREHEGLRALQKQLNGKK